MPSTLQSVALCGALGTGLLSGFSSAHAAALVATYDFNNSLAVTGGGAPSLVSVDALGRNSFENSVVNGVVQRVFQSRGDGIVDTQNRPSDNGLYVNPNGILQVYPVTDDSTPFTNNTFHTETSGVSEPGSVALVLLGLWAMHKIGRRCGV